MQFTQKIPKFQRVLLPPGDPLQTIEELKRITRSLDGIWVSHADLKEFMSCLFAVIWLEEPRGKIFQRKAEKLIKKYQQLT